MKKIKFVLIALMLSVMLNSIEAQTLRVIPLSKSDVSETAADMLYNRLNQAVSLNGMAATDNSNKFLLIPSITILSVEQTTTAPVMYVAEIEISLSLVDNDRKLLMTQEILTKKGVAENKTKAIEEAVKSLKARDSRLKKLIVNGKNEIVEYYNTECENVMSTIVTYLEMGMYDKALNELNAIPQIDAELDCYKSSMDILSNISAEQQTKSNNNIKNENPDVSWINE